MLDHHSGGEHVNSCAHLSGADIATVYWKSSARLQPAAPLSRAHPSSPAAHHTSRTQAGLCASASGPAAAGVDTSVHCLL